MVSIIISVVALIVAGIALWRVRKLDKDVAVALSTLEKKVDQAARKATEAREAAHDALNKVNEAKLDGLNRTVKLLEQNMDIALGDVEDAQKTADRALAGVNALTQPAPDPATPPAGAQKPAKPKPKPAAKKPAKAEAVQPASNE